MKKAIFCAAMLAVVVSGLWAKKTPDLYDEKKMHPTDRSGLEKFLGTNRYDVFDEAVMYITPVFGKTKAKRGNFIYRRGTDVAGFRIYYDTTAYTVEMAQEPRKICCDAIDKYMEDFAEKRLDKSAKKEKTRKIYGSAPGYQEYGVAMNMMNYRAKPKFNFGYAFVNGNPYFVIHVDKAKNLALEGKSTDLPNLESIAQNYYFTRAQAQKLKEFISEENIGGYHAEEEAKLEKMKADAEADVYVESDSEEDYTERDDYTEIKTKEKKNAKNKEEQNPENAEDAY